ncbi:MAG: hypothetical protein HKN25_06865 [Pyrinomonadaceae bacterium]|nr:hypothetical protein [Pyrinomonadaceae bacterium]
MRFLIPIFILFALGVSALAFEKTGTGSGRLDSSFGQGGKLTFPAVPSPSTDMRLSASKIVIQQDGKIIVAGTIDPFLPGVKFVLLLRYDGRGNLDQSFGVGGVVRTYPGGSARDVTIQPDGKIVVAARHRFIGSTIHRFNPDGTPDESFGLNGVSLPITLYELSAIRIAGDGKILAAGSRLYPFPSPDSFDFALLRFNSDGIIDSSFGTYGTVETDIGINDSANSIRFDGTRIVLGGTVNLTQSGGGDFALAKYRSDGRLDRSFGNDGTVITPLTNAKMHNISIDSHGVIYAAGSSGIAPNLFTIAKYMSNGSTDDSFGGGAITSASTGGILITNGLHAFSIVATRRNGIFAGGLRMGNFLLRKFNEDGSLDSSWGTNGSTDVSFGSTTSGVKSIAVTARGDVYAVGTVEILTTPRIGLAKLSR